MLVDVRPGYASLGHVMPCYIRLGEFNPG